MIVNGTVLLLSCPECEAQQPHFQFCGDTDTITDGMCSAGDREGRLLALFMQGQSASGPQFEGTVMQSAKLSRTIQHGPSAAGCDFTTFLKFYRSPELKFHCPWCDAAEMSVSREMKPHEFVDAGGRIDCIGTIELREGPAFS